MAQHFEKTQKQSAHPTCCLHISFLLLISEVARTGRHSTRLVRNEFMVCQGETAYPEEKAAEARTPILQFKVIPPFVFFLTQ